MRKRLFFIIIVILTNTLSLFAHSFTLVIDAGHGGHDAGAIGSFSKEKDINLRTALAFGSYVERNCPDVKVIYTRTTDVFVTLNGRAEIANKAKADLFISIHTNSLPAGHVARGLETYTLGMHRASDNLDVAKRENSVILVEKDYKTKYEGFDPNSSESYIMFEFMQDHNMAKSVELAKLVQSNVCASANRPNKGVKQAGFLVLRETSMPSCLIELGFISTPDEEQLLNNSGFIDNTAKGIYNAFIAYKKKYDGNISVPYRKETSSKIDIPTVVPPTVDIQDPDSLSVKTNTVVRKRHSTNDSDGDSLRLTPDASVSSQAGVQTGAERKSRKSAEKTNQQNQSAKSNKQNSVKGKSSDNKADIDGNNGKQGNADKNGKYGKVENKTRQTDKGKQTDKVSTQKEKTSAKMPADAPVFKIQICTADHVLSANDSRLKGQKADYFKDGKTLKYTLGNSTNYNEIYRLRKSLVDKFPDSFIIAFKNGKKMDVNEAIKEFLANKSSSKSTKNSTSGAAQQKTNRTK